jgi:hypothetical protein
LKCVATSFGEKHQASLTHVRTAGDLGFDTGFETIAFASFLKTASSCKMPAATPSLEICAL